MPRPRTHDDALRQRLLDRAGELLADEGVKALSLRRLAGAVGTSTTAVYSLFGNKPGLVNELYVEGFRRFGARLRAVPPTNDVFEDLVRIGLEYRASALADRRLYPIMFTNAVPGFEPDAACGELARQALRPLWDRVRAGIAAGALVDAGTDVIAVGYWACVHGLVSLELSHMLPGEFDMCTTYRRALRAHAEGWRR